jgi:tRNA 2-thiouridine synthesizing protein E
MATNKKEKTMQLKAGNKVIDVDEEGYLLDPNEWDEEVACVIAEQEGIELTPLHWMLISYFRDFYEDHMRHPTMHEWVKTLGKFHGKSFEEAKKYRDFLYELFPKGPVQTLAKLAGLPKPVEDVEE